MAENTVVMFSSDNGPETASVVHMRADFSHDGARPWRGVKRDQWEGGHRVPFIVRWPGKIAAGSTSEQTKPTLILMNLTQTTLAALCLLTIPALADQQLVYPPATMPRVDMHTHMDAKTQYAKSVEAMDQWGGTISITLAGLFWVKDNDGNKASPTTVRQIPGNDMVYVKEKFNDRILFVPGAFTIPKDGIWWGVDEIKTFKEQGFVGLKLWPHGAILTSKIPQIHVQLDEAGRQGMPLVAFHTGDPGDATGNNAAFPKFEDDTIEVVKAHPQTTFIFAHGLFMLENDQGLEKLAGIFDQYANVFVDLAFTHNARQPKQYTVSKAREFYLKYKDRILFGSDVFAADVGASGFLNERKLLETDEVTSGLHGGPKLEGFKLPDSVLNHIYYWNAARLIPRVRQVLEARDFKIGYEFGNIKFDRLPPDVTVNKLTMVSGQLADLTGTLGSVTDSLTVEIAGKFYQGIDNRDGTWKLLADKISGLPTGIYDIKVTARNSIGLVRTDSTINELTIAAQTSSLFAPDVRRVVFLGDSITYGGNYVSDVIAYQRMRESSRQMEFINVGLASETTSGLSEPGHAGGKFPRPDLHERLARVLDKTKPDLVIACYGMNDGIFLPYDAARFHAFTKGMTRFHETVEKSGAKIIHVTPPIFDGVNGGHAGYAEVLDRFSEWLVTQRTHGWRVVDLHTPMKQALAAGRAKDPGFALAKDGVHPGEQGHWLMARTILTALGAKDLEDITNADGMFSNEADGKKLLGLIHQQSSVMKDAWLTDIGHKRPQNPGLPLAEARTKAAEVEAQIQKLLPSSK